MFRGCGWKGTKALCFFAVAFAAALAIAGLAAVQAGTQGGAGVDGDSAVNEASVTIGGSTTEYPTLKEAVDAAQVRETNNEARVTLLKDITSTAQLVFAKPGAYTLDLGSYKVTCSGPGDCFLIAGDKDGAIPADLDDMSKAVKLSVVGSGDINASSGTVIRSVGTIVYGDGGTAPSITCEGAVNSIFRVDKTCRLTIDGGTFTRMSSEGAIVQSSGDLTVKSGKFNQRIELLPEQDHLSAVKIDGGEVPELVFCRSSGSGWDRECGISSPRGEFSKLDETSGNISMSFSGGIDAVVTLFKDITLAKTLESDGNVTINGRSLQLSPSHRFIGDVLIDVKGGALILSNVSVNPEGKCRGVSCAGGTLMLQGDTTIRGGGAGEGILKYAADLRIGPGARAELQSGGVGNALADAGPDGAGVIAVADGIVESVYLNWSGKTSTARMEYQGGLVRTLMMASNGKGDGTEYEETPSPSTGEYQKSAMAAFDGIGYETLEKAVAAATSGGEVEVLKEMGCMDTDGKVTFTGPVRHKEYKEPQVEPTCTQKGHTEITCCSVCGAVIDPGEEIAAMGHTVVNVDGKAATCTEAGYTASSYCSVCKADIVAKATISAKGHSPAQYGGEEPTCTGPGRTPEWKCSVCGTVTTPSQTIPAKGHDYVQSGGKDPTCASPGSTPDTVCSRCGDVLSHGKAIPAKGHSPVADTPVPATKASEGLTAGSHCSACGTVLIPQSSVPKLPADATKSEVQAEGDAATLKAADLKALISEGLSLEVKCTDISVELPSEVLGPAISGSDGTVKVSMLMMDDASI